MSLKTELALPRRHGIALLAAVPLCASDHRTSDLSIHQLGEAGFERLMGWPQGQLTRLALTYLATWVMEGGPA